MTDLTTKAGDNHKAEWRTTINQIFGLFEVNYHHQFYSAFQHNPDQLKQVKTLWRDSLMIFTHEQVLIAAKSIIETSEYLPTLHTMIKHCSEIRGKHPSPHQAYVEACQAASPKSEQTWSHPAVYEAGRRSDWFFLATTAEQFAFPVFRNHYQDALKQFNEGVTFEQPALPDQGVATTEPPVSRKDGLNHLKTLKKSLNL